MVINNYNYSVTEHSNGDGDYTSSLLGILVMQDVHLGLLVALLPALAGHNGATSARANTGAVHNIISGHDNANNSGKKYPQGVSTLDFK